MTIYAGATGPGETQRYTITAPTGVNLTTATWSLSITVHRPDETTATLDTFANVAVAATQAVVDYVPDGTEWPTAGRYRLCPTLTADGTDYRLTPWTEEVRPYC